MKLFVVYFFSLAAVLSVARADGDLSRKLAWFLMQEAKNINLYSHPSDLQTDLLPGKKNLASSYPEPALNAAVDDRSIPLVNTTSGLVTGSTAANVHVFYEIPYAEPPVGALRFQPTKPLETPRNIDGGTNNKLQCFQMERSCISPVPGSDIACNRINMKEDCLVLNVYVPNNVNLSDSASPPIERLPVMFYVHGGSFNGGTGHGIGGTELAHVANVILVTINYRLGPFGFLVNKEDGKPDIVGNQGIKDQQMALKWVSENIKNFGGDKDRVTIFGGSAGAQSIMFHTLSEKSSPYYWRAIQQSNPVYIEYHTPDESQRITNATVVRLCNDIASRYDCLMNVDPIRLTSREIPVMVRSFLVKDIDSLVEPFRPVLDGVEFTDQPLNLYKQGKWNTDKSMIVGVNTEELDDIEYFLPESFPTGEFIYTWANYYIVGIGKADKVVKKYSALYPPEEGSYIKAFSKQMTHMFFICPSRALARIASQTATGGAEVYFYANAHPVLDGSCKSRNNGSEEGCYLASHDDETRFVMRTAGNPSAADVNVENQFSTYWGSFARTGNPSSGLESSLGNFPDWPSYTEGIEGSGHENKLRHTPELYSNIFPMIVQARDADDSADAWKNIKINDPISAVETGYEEDVCDFWDSLGIYMDPVALPSTTTTTTTLEPGVTDPQTEKTTSAAEPKLKGNWLVTISLVMMNAKATWFLK